MKIGMIYLGRRGAGLPISLELARFLAQSDQVLGVLSRSAAAAADWKSLGIETLSVDTYQNLAGAVWSWIDQRRMRRLADQISSWQPEVLLFPMFYTWNPFLQARLRRIPAVIAVHDPKPHPGLSDRLFYWMENRSIRLAKRCLVFSASLVSELARRGVEPANIDVIRLGAFTYGTGESSAAPATVETEPILPALLFFGRITAYKGLEVLLQAFKQVSEKHSATLLIAGGGDLRPYRQWIEGDENIQVINRWIADVEVASVFQRANLVVLPYTSASQSGVIPIAASFRLPVIATRTGGIPEQIQDGLSGLLVEPGSVEKLSAAIERLLVDPEFRRSLGERLHDNFQNKHNWEQTAALVKAALEKAGAP